MAEIHGRKTVVLVDSNDLSTFITNASFPNEGEVSEVTGLTRDRRRYIRSLANSTFSIEGFYDDGATGPAAILEPLVDSETPATVVRRVEGTGAGLPEMSFSAFVTSYEETSPVDDVIGWTAEFQVSGDLTTSTQV